MPDRDLPPPMPFWHRVMRASEILTGGYNEVHQYIGPDCMEITLRARPSRFERKTR